MVSVAATRTTRSSLAGPVLVAAGGVALGVYTYVRNPSTQRGFIPCPLHSMTGLWCPGCGMTRGLHKLLHGDVVGMLGMNIFLPFLLGAVVWGWLSWVQDTRGARPLPRFHLPTWAWWALGASVVAYGVLRNLPVAPFSALAP